ncbi:MAG: hypothetical protein ACYC7H_11660 [Chloroflexota bacterium]
MRRTHFETLNVLAVFAHGAIGGLIAGTIFALAQVVAAALSGLPPSAPLQAIAAMSLGPDVLSTANLTSSTAAVAVGIHAVLSVTYGVILALLAMAIFAVGTSWPGAVVTGLVWGFVLWLVNFFLIAPLAFPWLATSYQLAQLPLHVVGFGLPLGLYLGRTLAHPAED